MFILIEKERNKTVCEAILREIIFVYIRSATRPSLDNQIFSPSWVYHTFLKCYYDEKIFSSFSLDSDFIFGKNAPCQLLRFNFKNKFDFF